VRIQGSRLLPGSREQVWDFLTDPARLAKCLPGCEALEPAGPDRYKVSVKFGVAAITGKYAGSVELAEKKQPESLRMRVEGKGIPGFMKGEGKLELRVKGAQTELRYDGEAQVGGVIASVGQRMIESVAKKIIHEFFECAAAQLQAEGKAG
jgi:carbon monoxide dehydrogenase subunit G